MTRRIGSRGWTVVDGIATLAEARDALTSVVALDRSNDEVVRRIAPSELELLDESWLPPPDGGTTSYLSLHFDHGHPLFPIQPADLCLYVALYLPSTGRPSVAATRIAALHAFRGVAGWGTAAQVGDRLRRYAQSHGSSWDWDGDSGHRVSCFARVLDALCAPHRLTNFRTTPRDQWYEISAAGHEFQGFEEEQDFYAYCGVGLSAIEEQVVLRPGELLVVNNVRAVHGRVGRRVPGEVYQFVVGARQVLPGNVSVLRHFLTESLSEPQSSLGSTSSNELLHSTRGQPAARE